MNHLDEVAGAIGADVGDTGSAINVGRDGLKDGAEGLPGLGRTSWHDGGTVQRAFFATGDSSTDEVAAFRCDLLLTANGVREQRVTAVDDDIALIHGVSQLVDDGIGSLSCLNHDDGLARALQRGNEILDGFRRNEVTFLAVLCDECTGLLGAAVVHRNCVAIASKVAR